MLQELLRSIRDLIYELRERGFYLGDDVIKMVLRDQDIEESGFVCIFSFPVKFCSLNQVR